jgi:hypothetical protein
MKTPKHLYSWIAASVVTLALAGYFTSRLLGEDRLVFTPGVMTHGHYQIELACNACHMPFAGVNQQACIDCHGTRLAASNDSHPKKKFEDPRNADRLEVLNALVCVTCHLEHRPQQTRAMGVTLPHDYCFHCHQEVGEDRPSHKDLAFNSCATAGCHNYHDNTALYEDFLVKHANEPEITARPVMPARDLASWMRVSGLAGKKPLGRGEQDAPAVHANDKAVNEWAVSAHARSGVNCRDCHQPKDQALWNARPGLEACSGCHERESKGFLGGKHGMRLVQKLPVMTPAQARRPMKADAHDRGLGCNSCHSAHAFDTRVAAAEACLGCHDDDHSRAYEGSPHHRLWQAELSGAASPGHGVTCATCHLPRETHRQDEISAVRVEHNQNWNLRPNEKMAKSVCLNCHGLGFVLDALADSRLIASNFTGKPARHIESVEWAAKRVPQPSQGGIP